MHNGMAGLVAILVLFTGCSDASSRLEIDLTGLSPEQSNPDYPFFDDLSDVTGDICSEIGCVQSVTNDYVNIHKFASAMDAAEYAEPRSSCEVIDPLVVEFLSDDMSDEEKAAVVGDLSNINAGSNDDF